MAIDFPSNPTNGQVYGNWIYDSSITAWRNVNTDTGIGTLNAMGLKNAVPTSISVGSGSATVNGNGTVSFNSVSSITLENVFTSTYENYKIIIDIKNATGGNTASIRARVGSATSSYAYQYLRGYNANVNGGYASSDPSWWIAPGATTTSTNIVDSTIYAPFNSGVTKLLASSGGYTGVETQQYNMFGELPAGSRTSFTLFPSSNGITGTITIYGYTN